MDPEPSSSFRPWRPWRISLNVGLSVVALLALVVMANYLAVRHCKRFDWTSSQTYKLSPLTLHVLKSLTNDIKVTVFYRRTEELYPAVSALLNEYRLASSHIQVNEVDYRQDPTAGEQVKEKYRLSFASAKNVIVFDGYGQTNIVLEKQLSEYDLSHLQPGQTNEIKRVGFKGEQLFTSAIVRIADPRVFKAYFLRGHGQADPGNEDNDAGYSKFAGLLAQNHFVFERVSLLGTNGVPADCQLLIAAGPTDAFDESEADKIEKYLNQGGRFLALLRTTSRAGAGHSGLETLLARWGVEVGQNWVIDPDNSKLGNILTTNFSGHAIVRGLAQSEEPVVVVLPRSVRRAQTMRKSADAAQVDELFRTSRAGQAITRIEKGLLVPSPRDSGGEISLAVAVEKGSIEGIHANRGATRMVVVGDSILFNNAMLMNNAGNYDFAHLALSWLLDRPSLLGGIGPRPIREINLTMTSGQLHIVRWLLLGAIPGSIVLPGLFVWWRRRS